MDWSAWDWTTWYWVGWLLIGFLPIELYAAWSKEKGDTLSENIWDWFAIVARGKKHGRLRRFILLGFISVLASHFIFATPATWVVIFGAGIGWAIWYSLKHDRRER
jgi:hypothetical protein